MSILRYTERVLVGEDFECTSSFGLSHICMDIFVDTIVDICMNMIESVLGSTFPCDYAYLSAICGGCFFKKKDHFAA
jgi:hypothetical protein